MIQSRIMQDFGVAPLMDAVTVRRARSRGCQRWVRVRRGAGVDGIGAARARAGSHRGILRNHCAKKAVAFHTARLGRAPLIPWKKVVLRR